MNLRALFREPALLVDAFETLIVICIAGGLFDLHGDQQTNLVAAFIALLALVKGFLTHPFPVTVIPDFGRAALVLCVSFSIIHVTPDFITLVATFLGTLITIIQRAQISPRYDSITRPGGAGAGPTTAETGATDLRGAGIGLVVIGAILLVVGYLAAIGILITLGWIALVVGLILFVVALISGGTTRV